MLPSELLIYRYLGESLVPKRLPLNHTYIELALEYINCLRDCLGLSQKEVDKQLTELEGDSPDYRLKRGFAHLLKNSFATFEIISPISPQELRRQVFSHAAQKQPIPTNRLQILAVVANCLSEQLNREVLPSEIERGLYADLPTNRILSEFNAPEPLDLLHRYNLAQVQGVFYRATHLVINAHRNDPGEYKLLFRYLKLFQLMSYIEGDADTGFTITIDGPASLFKPSTRYGLALAKMLPALLHVSRWSLHAKLSHRDRYTGVVRTRQFTLDDGCGLVSHYAKGKTYDSMLE